MKIIINRRYGGFGVSEDVFEELIKRGWEVTKTTEKGNYRDQEAPIVRWDKKETSLLGKYSFTYRDENDLRSNKDLIEVVMKLGDKANSQFSELKIVDIPDDVEWQIEEYDGLEWVSEIHRTWN